MPVSLLLFLLHGKHRFVKTPSVEPVLRSRPLPRISFKLALVATTLAAIIAAVARTAGEGGAVAMSVIFMLAFPVACLLLFAVLFLICWSVSLLWYESDDDALHGSPFAEGQLPPQILPPREQKS